MGTNQVSVRTKMVNATWIAARPQWYFWSIGLTNSVQPYCRLAIITMQMMPKISWPQRVASDAVARDEIASDVLVATVSSIPALLIDRAARLPLHPLTYEPAPIASQRFNLVPATPFLHEGLTKRQRGTKNAWNSAATRGTRCRTPLCAATFLTTAATLSDIAAAHALDSLYVRVTMPR